MEIGTGIAVAGIWLFPCVALISKQVTNWGVWLTVLIAIAITSIII